jgi:uncharacterized protein (TIGR02453 family)
MTEIDLTPVLQFAADLKLNNNRPWFIEHKADFDQARVRFEEFVADLIFDLAKTENLGGITPKDCIFRLNRDLRFTQDKTPYKPYLSAYIAPGGRKSRLMGYYVHLEPGNVMLAGGLYEPEPRQLTAFRDAIALDAREFKSIISDPKFVEYFGGVGGDALKTIPRGFSPDHPEAALLRLKTVTVIHKVTDNAAVAPGFFEHTLETFGVMKPFLHYLAGFV